MSTVLKAVQEIERRGAPLVQGAPATARVDRRWGLWVAAAATVLVGMALAAQPLVRSARRGGSVSVAPGKPVENRPVIAVAVAPPPPAGPAVAEPLDVSMVSMPALAAPEPARAIPPSVPEMESPWGRVAALPGSEPAVRAVPKAPPERARAPRLRPAPRIAAEAAPLEVEEAALPVENDAPVAAGSSTRSGMPGIRVRAINYRASAVGRTVTLGIAGGRPVTLHEGESAAGVEVQLIMSDAVYVRHRGDIFAVGLER